MIVGLAAQEMRCFLCQTRNIVSNHIARTDRTDRIDCIVRIDCTVHTGHSRHIGHIAHTPHTHRQGNHCLPPVVSSVVHTARKVTLAGCSMVIVLLL